MKLPDNMKKRDIARILFAPVMIFPVMTFFFLSFSFWKKGLTEPAIIFGVMGIGLILLVFLLVILHRIIGERCFVLCCAILLILFGLYCLVTKDIYDGITFTLFGAFLILTTVFPEKHWQISMGVVFVLALGGINYIEHFSGDKTQSVASEMGDKHPDDSPDSVAP